MLFCAFADVCFQIVGPAVLEVMPSSQCSAVLFVHSDLPVCWHSAPLLDPCFFGCRAKCYCCATKLAPGTVSFTVNRTGKTDLYHIVKLHLISVCTRECLPLESRSISCANCKDISLTPLLALRKILFIYTPCIFFSEIAV